MSKDSSRPPRYRRLSVSVVIPARNASELLPDQLAALVHLDHDYQWEIVVVDNASTDDTAQVAVAWSDRLPVKVVAASDKPGVSYARNIGIKAAQGDLIVFCDADDQVSEDWLRSIVEASLEWDAVGGATDLAKLNDPEVISWNSLTLAARPRLAGEFMPAVGAGNLSVWADVLAKLDGFDEDYEYGSEDIDFCWRLQLAGYRLGFSQKAVIHIRARDNLRSMARQFYRYGRGSALLYRNFRSVGMPRSRIRHTLKSWAWLLVHLPDLARSPSMRGNWMRTVALRTGRIVGSVENRTVYL